MQPGLYEKQIQVGRLYGRTVRGKRRLQFALDGIEAMLKLSGRSYVGVSFGKQSLCLAHMVYRMRPEMPMFFLASSESWLIHNFETVIDDFMNQFPIRLTIVQTNRMGLDISQDILSLSDKQSGIKWVFRGWNRSADNETWKAARDAGDKDLQRMCERAEWDGWFWGLAKEESRGRRITLSRRWEEQPHRTIFRYKDGKFRCCPLMNWEIDDIAAYVAANDLRLLAEYEHNGLQTRTTARVTKMMAENAGVVLLKGRQISSLNRLAKRFPELGAMT